MCEDLIYIGAQRHADSTEHKRGSPHEPDHTSNMRKPCLLGLRGERQRTQAQRTGNTGSDIKAMHG